jgi:hypothetical protein
LPVWVSLRQLTLLLRQSLPGPQPPKDTTSKLVVTPLGSLAFQYAEGIKGFNSQKGLFDVAIEGDATATAFKLTSSDHQHPDSAGYLRFHAERGRGLQRRSGRKNG